MSTPLPTREGVVRSADGTPIHYEVTGQGEVALVLAHGWLGSARWWDGVREAFAPRYQVVALDLAGHGQSGRTRTDWTFSRYAEDIRAVAGQVQAGQMILVGHSMSGAYVLEAALTLPRVHGLVVVDTLKNLAKPPMSREQIDGMLSLYKADFKKAVAEVLPAYLYAKTTPEPVRARLQREFLEAPPGFAAIALEPLYQKDLRELAARVAVPVRAILSDVEPVDPANNRKYLKDYDLVTMKGVGHYPMLEDPAEFHRALEACLASLGAR
jgi:pimeloyl-ACP methyl ester carboxylesterase